MDEQTCDTCFFWEGYGKDGYGRCHVNPPKIIGSLSRVCDNENLLCDMVELCTQFPCTSGTDWCGAWRAEEMTP